MITSSTSDNTTFPKATPIITPTAKSTTLPRLANSLNSLNTGFLLCSFDEGNDCPGRIRETLGGLSVTGIIVAAKEKERGEAGRARDLPRALPEDASLARPQDQDRANHAAQDQQAAAGRQHRTNPKERHT